MNVSVDICEREGEVSVDHTRVRITTYIWKRVHKFLPRWPRVCHVASYHNIQTGYLSIPPYQSRDRMSMTSWLFRYIPIWFLSNYSLLPFMSLICNISLDYLSKWAQQFEVLLISTHVPTTLIYCDISHSMKEIWKGLIPYFLR